MNDNNKQNPGLDGREIPAICLLLTCAFWYQYGHNIQIWLHENMVEVVLIGIFILMVCGYIIVRRFQKKNEEDINRMKRLSQAKPQAKSPERYFERRPKRDFDHE